MNEGGGYGKTYTTEVRIGSAIATSAISCFHEVEQQRAGESVLFRLFSSPYEVSIGVQNKPWILTWTLDRVLRKSLLMFDISKAYNLGIQYDWGIRASPT